VNTLKKSQRACPALGTTISSRECGSGRGSRYSCPEECPYFPFTPANEERFFDLEEGVLKKLQDRVRSALSGEDLAARQVAHSNGGADPKDELAAHAELMQQSILKRDADGHSFAERWVMDPRSDLTNDERVLLKAMDQVQPILLEVERFPDEQTIEGTDLLTGKTVRILDHLTAQHVSRYTAFLGWWYPMPFRDRLSGMMEPIPDCGSKSPLEVVQEVVRHLGGPLDPEKLAEWLAWNFFRVCEAIRAASSARKKEALENGNYVRKTTDYSHPDRAHLEARMEEHRAFLSDDPWPHEEAVGFDRAWHILGNAQEEAGQPWVGQGAAFVTEDGHVFLGRLLTGKERIRIEATGEHAYARAHSFLNEVAGDDLQFLAEVAQDRGAQLSGSVAAYDPDLVPASLLEDNAPMQITMDLFGTGPEEEPPTMESFYRDMYRHFADEPLQALGGLTPRDAAGIPEKRAQLMRLMKRHVRDVDRRRRQEGLDFDLNPLLEDLGLLELVSAPAPLGGPAPDQDQSSEEDGEIWDALWPERKSKPISPEEVETRLARVRRRYPDPQDAVNAMEKRFPEFLQGVYQSGAGIVEPAANAYLRMGLLHLLLIMAPEGVEMESPCLVSVAEGSGEQLHALNEFLEDEESFEEGFPRWVAQSREPAVLADVIRLLTEHLNNPDPRKRLSPKNSMAILAVSAAVLDELAQKNP
jgi:hypothetical protein